MAEKRTLDFIAAYKDYVQGEYWYRIAENKITHAFYLNKTGSLEPLFFNELLCGMFGEQELHKFVHHIKEDPELDNYDTLLDCLSYTHLHYYDSNEIKKIFPQIDSYYYEYEPDAYLTWFGLTLPRKKIEGDIINKIISSSFFQISRFSQPEAFPFAAPQNQHQIPN